MRSKLSVESMLDAAQWGAIVFVGMLAVVCLVWSLEITSASQSGTVAHNDDRPASAIDLAF